MLPEMRHSAYINIIADEIDEIPGLRNFELRPNFESSLFFPSSKDTLPRFWKLRCHCIRTTDVSANGTIRIHHLANLAPPQAETVMIESVTIVTVMIVMGNGSEIVTKADMNPHQVATMTDMGVVHLTETVIADAVRTEEAQVHNLLGN